jgi:hypothetical protein
MSLPEPRRSGDSPSAPASFDDEVGQAASYERGLAVMGAIALLLVAMLVTARLILG